MKNNKIYSYVYQITNNLTLKKYIGSRSCDIEPSKDIGIVYYSSSSDKDFIIDQKENPLNYHYEVLAIFDNIRDALNHEIILHEYFDVHLKTDYYNKAKQTSSGFSTAGISIGGIKGPKNPLYGKKRPEHSKLMTGTNNPFYGKTHSDQTLTLLSEQAKSMVVARNVVTSETVRISKEVFDNDINLVGTTKGKSLSQETKDKISEAIKGRRKPTSICPRCNKEGANHLMVRYHFDNCKGIKI